ncbi:MAG: deoxyribonuclease IV [SAR202 cluster bacterium]|nr:deoxyribonuclease IV [SAR202 cluster bacterium]
MKVGAHVSTAGGLHTAIDRAQEMGAETIQIFASSPRAWAFKPPSDEVVKAFREKAAASGIGPTFLHGIYLVNLGGPALLEQSVASLTAHLGVASRMGASGVIFHAGSHKGVGFDGVLPQAVAAITKVLVGSPKDAWLIIENSTGMGNHIGASFEEIGRIIVAVGSERVKVCLDTQHSVAAGYMLLDKDGLEKAMTEFDRHIGLERLVAVHANDSKVPPGSGVDRHENIGDGSIGEEGFLRIMSHAAFRDVPFLLEVPGIEGGGPDKANLDRLKAIRAKAMAGKGSKKGK